MYQFTNWKFWTITVSATVGGVYGLFSLLNLNPVSLSLWDVSITAGGGAALGGSVASALCRLTDVWEIIRETRDQPSDYRLCYRGTRQLDREDRSEYDHFHLPRRADFRELSSVPQGIEEA